MHLPRRLSLTASLALLAFVSIGVQAMASSVAVGKCTALSEHYTTIQAAVNASPPGTTIEICPGIYPEQVSIANKLTLKGVAGAGQEAAVIVPPAAGLVQNAADSDSSTPIAAQILVQNTSKGLVTISNLTVDGTGNLVSTCDLNLVGILFQNASGSLNHVAVRNQAPVTGYETCPIGLGIYVQTATGSESKVDIDNSSVHNYNKNGITANDAGTTLNLTGDIVQGNGVVPCSASYQGAFQNGIQIAFGATGTILESTVVDNVYAFDPTIKVNGSLVCDYESADVILFETAENSGVKIEHNVLGNSQAPLGIYTDGANLGDGVSAIGNTIFGAATFDAIDVCTNSNTVSNNIIVNSAESGVHFDKSCGTAFAGSTGQNNVAADNTILESACAGILDDWAGAGHNSYATEADYAVPLPVTSSTASCPFVANSNAAGKAGVNRVQVESRQTLLPQNVVNAR